MDFEADWISGGRWGGALVRSAEERVHAVTSDLSISLAVLDAVHADSGLAARLEGRELLADARLGRVGGEWTEQRGAIAHSIAESFEASWPQMRRRLQESSLVALVAAMESYAVSLFVEFSAAGGEDGQLRREIGNKLRNQINSLQSTSGGWCALADASSLPDRVKSEMQLWKTEHGAAVDEMTRVRNSLVHGAGLVDDRLAAILRQPPKSRLEVSDRQLLSYRHACISLTCVVDPPL